MRSAAPESNIRSCLMTKEVRDYYYANDKNAIKRHIEISDYAGCMNAHVEGKEPLISVVIPTHNRVDMLQRALDSLLSQEYGSIQIVVVDDCSTDQTKEIILDRYSGKGIEIYRNETNINAGLSRNRGYNYAKGEYIVFMDDDDYYVDRFFFRKATHIHEQYVSLAFVSANSFIEDITKGSLACSQMNRDGFIDGQTYLDCFQTGITKPNSTFTSVFDKSILDRLGFESMEMMNDTSIYLRSLLLGDAYIMRDVIGTYVIHSSNISGNISVDFITKNLKEKKHVYDYAMETKARVLSMEWLSNQMLATLKFYLYGNNVGFSDFFVLIRWMRENKIPAEYYASVFSHFLKGKARRLLHV